MNQAQILVLLKEALCASDTRQSDIQHLLKNAAGVHEPAEIQKKMQEVVNRLYTETLVHPRSVLMLYLPVFLIICGDGKDRVGSLRELRQLLGLALRGDNKTEIYSTYELLHEILEIEKLVELFMSGKR